MEFFTRHGPGDVQGEGVCHTDEVTGFVVDCYALAPTGKMLYDSAFYSRPKGCDKSGQAARFAMFEALGPCRWAGQWAKGGETYTDPWGLGFVYEYQRGEPMGRPVKVPYVRILATEEGQTGNVYDTIHFNLTDDGCPLHKVPGLDCGITRTNLPGGGQIMPSTASNSAKDGGKETFVAFDETHLYTLPELRRMYATVTRNLRKRKKIAGTWYLETTTWYATGTDSVAEATYRHAQHAKDGKLRQEARLLFDHRWGDVENLDDETELRAGLEASYGDALAWNDLDGMVAQAYDTRTEPSDFRRFFLNAPSGAVDAWVEPHYWTARLDVTKVVADGDVVTIGFDGSRQRARGVADSTALIGCRVSDGHLFEIAVWEQPPGEAGKGWEVPQEQVEAVLAMAMKNYRVVAMWADPSRWESNVAAWEARYGPKLHPKCRAAASHPIKLNLSKRVNATLNGQLEDAIIDGMCTHGGDPVLTRHVLNTRTLGDGQIGKETRDSVNKVDAAIAATYAWGARLAAVAAGLGRRPTSVPRRIR